MERDYNAPKQKSPKATRLLAVDAWIDTALYELGFKLGEIWEAVTIFSRRFRFTGWKGHVRAAQRGLHPRSRRLRRHALALALPAFEETEGTGASRTISPSPSSTATATRSASGIIQRDSVPVDEMPDHVIKAVLATEDRRFFEHYGIDFLGLLRAMSENVRANSVVQGGSSLTQQLAKNLFLTNERTVERKVKEAFLAIWLEMNLTKKEILQLYRPGLYGRRNVSGIAAAADFYFGKQVKDLELAEGAMLAGLFKAPAKYAPHINLPAARARANVVLTNRTQGGFMTEGPGSPGPHEPGRHHRPWRHQEPRLLPRLGVRGSEADCREARHPFHGRPHHDRHEPAAAAEESVEFHLRQHGGRSTGVTEGALVMMETNGAVRAIVGGSTTAPASSIAPPRRCARPILVQALCRRATAMEHGLRRSPRYPTPPSTGAAGSQRTIRAAIPAAWTC